MAAASAKAAQSAEAKIARSRVAAVGEALAAVQAPTTAAIGESRTIRRSTTDVADVRVGLLTDLVTSLDKIAVKEKAADSTATKATDLLAARTDLFAAKTTDRFAVKDLLESKKDMLASYQERFEPGYQRSVGTGGLAFALRDYSDNS